VEVVVVFVEEEFVVGFYEVVEVQGEEEFLGLGGGVDAHYLGVQFPEQLQEVLLLKEDPQLIEPDILLLRFQPQQEHLFHQVIHHIQLILHLG